jgi:pantoate--beta-alanine ligase
MRIIDSFDEITRTARGWLTSGTVGFVLLTSRIHEGHKVLLQTARQECEILVVCILDNVLLDPIAYGNTTHPQDILRDLRLPNIAPIDVVFLPQKQALYPPDFSIYVTPDGPLATQILQMNPVASLRTVATTITKLLQLVRPDILFLAQKDALQIALYQQLIRDFNIDIRLHIIPTVRLLDGLAVSNRNQFLTPVQRQEASLLYHALKNAQTHIINGAYNNISISDEIKAELLKARQIVLAHIMICHPDTLTPISHIMPDTVIIASARAGTVQLVDAIHWLPDGQWRS